MKAIIEFAYRKLGVKKICSDHAVDNPRSGKVMEKRKYDAAFLRRLCT